ncbi:MAG: ABC transporter substrate-binding protein [Actinomycetota bacterium]
MTPRNRFATLLVLALFAAACGDDGGGDDTASAPVESAPVGEPADDATASAPADDAPAEDPASDDAAPEPATRILETELGDFEVPARPERIVVTDATVALTTVLDLGVDVYGTWDVSGTGEPVGLLVTEEEWAGIEIVGSGIEPNIEALAASLPDLVLHRPIIDGDIEAIAELAPVAPLVPSLSWQDDDRFIADALGRQEEMDALLADYAARADALAARIDAEIGDPSVAVLRIRPDSIRVHTNLHFAGELLDDVGLRVPDDFVEEPGPTRADSTLLVRISIEQLGTLSDADYIFVLPVGTQAQSQEAVDAAVAEVQASALWQRLPAVQNDQVVVVDNYWFVGAHRAANAALADVEEIFFGG